MWYWQTLRHLKLSQIVGRVRFKLARPSVDARPSPAVASSSAGWISCARPPSMTGPRSFRFLGQDGPDAWARADAPKLWLYNLHYFDDLVADDAVSRVEWHRALIAQWISENPPGAGDGWEPYPLSLRIVNWIKWLRLGNAPVPGMLDSLAVQVRFLRGRLEHHLLGNHLWANAKALAFAGAYFQGSEAASWESEGLRLLRREVAEQVLPDGGHFERSPMYHAIVLEDMLDLHQMFGGDAWAGVAAGMLRWLRVMSHPDGEISFFNDAAFGIAPNLAALSLYAEALGVSFDRAPLGAVEALDSSGYVRLSVGPAVLLVDVAPVGPDYIPGHAHADTLSFELSLNGRRLIVNGGTSTYERGPLRALQRSTPMHNTVSVEGLDSSEVWAAFRVARRARPFDVSWGNEDGCLFVEGAHDGYRRLPGRVTHRRRWMLSGTGLQILDRLEGKYSSAEARYRLLGDIDWQADGGRIEAGHWYPRFGVEAACRVLVVPASSSEWTTEFRWA